MTLDSAWRKISPRKLFLVDSLGALLTAFMLGLVLSSLESLFGMPRKALYILSAIAFSYSGYSFFCYAYLRQGWPPFLKGIAIANLLYCFLTIGLVIYFRAALTYLGLVYFLLEAVLIFGLVTVELKKASGKSMV